MPKKIYDIVPPGVKPKKEVIPAADAKPKRRAQSKPAVKKLVAAPVATTEPIVAEAPQKSKPTRQKTRRRPVKELVIGAVCVVLLLGVWAYLKLPKADVQIWPTTSSLNFQEKILASTSATSVNVDSKTLPARYIESTKAASQEFPATGSSSNNGVATGTITVYNKISPSEPFTLIKGTHFLSNSGKYFVTTEKIVVPAANGKTPGSITVHVQAEQTGSDSNIGPSSFSIPKLNGTAYYYGLYGQSTSSMTGGHTGTAKQVTSDDLQSAKEVLSQKVVADAQSDLNSKLASNEILLDGASVVGTVNTTSDVPANTIADSFKETASVTVSGLVISKSDLDSFIHNDATRKLAQGSDLLESSLQHTDQVQTVDPKNGKLSLVSQITATIYPHIDTVALVSQFTGKSAQQINDLAAQLYAGNIAKVQVNFWPFWVKSAPTDVHRVSVNLEFK